MSIAVRGAQAGFAEVSSQAEATTLGTLGFAAAVGFSRLGAIPGFQVPLSILLMDWAGSLIVLCGARVTGRLGWERYGRFFREARKVIVVGAGDAGATLARQVAARPDLGLEVVGFLDPEADTNGQTVAGKQVLGTPDELAAIAFSRNVETVFIATPDVSPSAARALKATAEAIGLEVQVVPRLDALISGRFTLQPREIDVRELLPRPPVRFTDDAVERLLRDKVVLVTGAAGSIGSEICRQIIASRPRRLILLDISENGLFFLARELRTALGL